MSDGDTPGAENETAPQEPGRAHSPSAPAGIVPGLVQWLIPVLEHRRLIIFLPAATAAFAILITLALPKTYTTSLAFTPVQAEASLGALSGLARQTGLALPIGDASTSPDFYARLIRTDGILLGLAQQQYEVSTGSGLEAGTFLDFYEIDQGNEGKSLAKAIEKLTGEVIGISFDRQTGIVSVDIRTKWRDLSYQMATELLDRLDEFNLLTRQGQARSEERFLRLRLDTARAELRAAENSLQRFLAANRAYQNDPILLFEHARLDRELSLKQSVYSTLIQSFESARLAAVRNTPSLSIVEQPRPALRFDRRRTLTKAAIGLMLGLFAAVAWISFRHTLLAAEQASPRQSAILRAHGNAVVDDVYRALPFLRKVRRPRDRRP